MKRHSNSADLPKPKKSKGQKTTTKTSLIELGFTKKVKPTFAKKSSPSKTVKNEPDRGSTSNKINGQKIKISPGYEENEKNIDKKINKNVNKGKNVQNTKREPGFGFKRQQSVQSLDKKEKKLTFEKKIGNKKNRTSTKTKKGKFQELSSKLIGKDGKPQWTKVKEEKKKLRETRRVHRTGEEQYQLSVKAKALWEKLRVRTHPPPKREALVSELFTLLKGQIPQVVHSHDMARVVQWMLKLGAASVRSAICEELCVHTVRCLQSQYASFCVRRALKYGTKTDRAHIFQACSGHFLKLISHTFASRVVEQMYIKFATSAQRSQMHREMYGEMHGLLPPEVATISAVPEDLRPAILAATKANLTKLLSTKRMLQYTLLQAVLSDFLSSCTEQDRTEILELIHSNVLDLLNSREGAKLALTTVWYATNKMKKVIVKSLKGRVKEMAMSEAGYFVLMALFDSVDDTVLIKKALIPELLNAAEELAKHEVGRKVILYLVAHRDGKYFHPDQIEIFSKGDASTTRKKESSVREQEMLEAVSEPLLSKIAQDPHTWLSDSSVCMVTLAIMKSGKGEALRRVFEIVADYILDPASVVEIEQGQVHVVELSAQHIMLRKLILQDHQAPHRAPETFSMVLASRLTEENLNHILKFNRGCFLLVLLFESNSKKVCKKVRSKITEDMKTFLTEQETTGSKILFKKLVKTE